MIIILAAAHILAGWLNYALVGTTVVSLAGVMWRTKGFVRGTELQGLLDQKNAIIETNQQSIESFRERVKALELDFERITHQAQVAREEVGHLRQQLSALESYAAPEAVKRFQQSLDDRAITHAAEYQEILGRLKVLEVKVDRQWPID